MVKDRFGQPIGPGDIVVDIDGQGYLRVVTKIWRDRDADGWVMDAVQVHWLSGEFSALRMSAAVDPEELFRVSDISDFDHGAQSEVWELESLYTTITGERYG